jgi:hypothetical protein
LRFRFLFFVSKHLSQFLVSFWNFKPVFEFYFQLLLPSKGLPIKNTQIPLYKLCRAAQCAKMRGWDSCRAKSYYFGANLPTNSWPFCKPHSALGNFKYKFEYFQEILLI